MTGEERMGSRKEAAPRRRALKGEGSPGLRRAPGRAQGANGKGRKNIKRRIAQGEMG